MTNFLKTVLILKIGVSHGVCYAQEKDTSFYGTYAVIMNYQDYDTLGYLTLYKASYNFTHKAEFNTRAKHRCDSTRRFICEPKGDYVVKYCPDDNGNDVICLIDFDPNNNNRTWRQILRSVYGLHNNSGRWVLTDQTSRSFPAYVFYKR